MAIIQPIPHKARYIPLSNTFSAFFNSPSLGKYDFGVTANAGQIVLELQPGTVYYIEGLSVGGNIAAEDYLGAILYVPLLTLRRTQGNDIVYRNSIPVVQFFQSKEISNFIWSEKSGDNLTIDCTGVLLQTSALVGIDPIKINSFLSIFAIDDRNYNAVIKGEMPADYSKALTRGL
jgi:hypothetical protein